MNLGGGPVRKMRGSVREGRRMRGDRVKMAKIHYIHVLNCQEHFLKSLV